ncbi:MAG TPA: MFS transporter [Methylomirabilota bacterium]|nr:MFS transporter [Methylomirabilota bacterium]
MFFPTRPHYFSHRINQEVKEIYWNAMVVNLALSITTLFEPIFLYRLGYSLSGILHFYALVYLGYAILVFLAAKITSRIGYKHSILVSNIFYVLYWVLLYQIKFHPILFFIAPFFFSLQKSFFWPPYHADIALNAKDDQRGREVGLLFSLIQMVSVAGPLVGGFIAAFLGFKELFILSSVLMLASVYPLFRSAEIYPKHNFRFRNFLLVIRKFPVNFFAYWGYAEDLMLMSLWPVYIFLVVPELLGVGFLITVASAIAIMIMLYIGRVIDQRKWGKFLQISSVFYGLTWFCRQFGSGFGQVFFFDSLTRTGKAMINVPMTALSYKLAGISGADQAIAYTVFYEFSLSIGKILTALLGIWILDTTGNIFYVFIVAGIFTMFYGFLKEKK